MLKKLKDRALSQGARAAFNRFFERYGRLHELNLDTQNKRIDLTITLSGETDPLHLLIGRYRLSRADGGYRLYLYEIESSRPWAQALARDFLEGRALPIPEEYGKILGKIV